MYLSCKSGNETNQLVHVPINPIQLISVRYRYCRYLSDTDTADIGPIPIKGSVLVQPY